MIYTIPNWDDKGNAQVYVEQPDGTFHDLYNEKVVSEQFVVERLVEHLGKFKAESQISTLP